MVNTVFLPSGVSRRYFFIILISSMVKLIFVETKLEIDSIPPSSIRLLFFDSEIRNNWHNYADKYDSI